MSEKMFGNAHISLQNKAMDIEDKYGCLPMHAAMQHSHFPCAKFLLDQWNEARRDGDKRFRVASPFPAERLAKRILESTAMGEEEFIREVNELFVELQHSWGWD